MALNPKSVKPGSQLADVCSETTNAEEYTRVLEESLAAVRKMPPLKRSIENAIRK